MKLSDVIERPRSGEWGTDDECGNGIPVLRTTNFTNEGIINYSNVCTRTIDKSKAEKKFLQHGDIIIEKSGGSDKQPVGRVVYFEGENNKYLFNNFTAALRVKDKSKWEPKFVFYSLFNSYLCGKTRAFQNKTTGLHNLQLADYIEDVNIPNFPLEIQREIAYNLDKVSEAIELCRKILDKLDYLAKAKFAEMFGEIAETVPLADIASYFNGLTYKPENVKVNGTIVLRSSNIKNSELDYQDLVRVDCRVKDKLFVKPNDILMCSRNGSAKLVGKVALIKECPEQMTFGAFMMIIRSEYYPYLFTYFQTNNFRNQIVTGATTTINQITSNMLNKVLIPLPSKEKVSEFAAFLNKTDLAKSAVKKTLDKAQTLKNALMQKYFG